MMKFFGVVLGLKNAQLKRGLDESKKDVQKFKADVEKGGGLLGGLVGNLGNLKAALAGGAGLAGLGMWLKQGADFAGDLQDKADQLGISVGRLQSINDVLADAGVNPEQAEKGIQSLMGKMADAVEGSQSARDAFGELKISLDDILNDAAAPDEMFLKVADGFANAADKGRALNAVQELLGRSGKKMTGAFKEGSKPFREMEQGFQVTAKEAESADKMMDRISKWTRKTMQVAPGKLAGMIGQAAGKVLSPEEWKKNLFGARAAHETMKDADPLAGLTPYQRGLVTKFGMDPEQARKMRPGAVEVQKTPEEKAKEKELHDELHDRGDRESQLRDVEAKAAKEAKGKNDRQAKAILFRRKAEFFADRAKNTEGETQAQAHGDLAELLRGRISQKTAENLMTPAERVEARRAERRARQAQKKARRQVAAEVGQDILPAKEDAKGDTLVAGAVAKVETAIKDRLKFPRN